MKLAEGVEKIDGTTANCYSVKMNGKEFLIDAGMRGSGKKIVSYYRSKNSKPDVVLITHYHPDHIGGLNLIAKEFNPEIFVPDKEASAVRGEEKPMHAKGVLPGLVSSLAKVEPVKAVRGVSELSEPGLQVIPSVGHTPGSTSFLFQPINGLFVGDAIVNKSGKASLNKGFTIDLAEARKSMDKLLAIPACTIYPGHGGPIPPGMRKIE